jgi:hypothetical protein
MSTFSSLDVIVGGVVDLCQAKIKKCRSKEMNWGPFVLKGKWKEGLRPDKGRERSQRNRKWDVGQFLCCLGEQERCVVCGTVTSVLVLQLARWQKRQEMGVTSHKGKGVGREKGKSVGLCLVSLLCQDAISISCIGMPPKWWPRVVEGRCQVVLDE